MLDFLNTSLHGVQTVSERYNTLLSIPYCFRTLYDIYQYRDSIQSEMFTNRTEEYYLFVLTSNTKINLGWKRTRKIAYTYK